MGSTKEERQLRYRRCAHNQYDINESGRFLGPEIFIRLTEQRFGIEKSSKGKGCPGLIKKNRTVP